jgi:hypothetical protein
MSGYRCLPGLLLASVCCALAPGSASGEGAVKHLACTLERVCDAAGRCEDASGELAFTMAPISLAPDGAGSYTISYADVEADMQARSELGPFYWNVGAERHALLISSETQWLWHTLTLQGAPVATIRFLVCSLTN